MANINGSGSSETLNGTNLDDVIDGLGGNDVINAGDGNDTITGGTGSDTIDGGAGDDLMLAESGAEWYVLSDTDNGDDTIDGFDFYTDHLDASAVTGTITVTVISSSEMVLSWSGGSVTLTNMVDDANNWSDNILFGSTYSGAVAGPLPATVIWDGTSGDDSPNVGDRQRRQVHYHASDQRTSGS